MEELSRNAAETRLSTYGETCTGERLSAKKVWHARAVGEKRLPQADGSRVRRKANTRQRQALAGSARGRLEAPRRRRKAQQPQRAKVKRKRGRRAAQGERLMRSEMRKCRTGCHLWIDFGTECKMAKPLGAAECGCSRRKAHERSASICGQLRSRHNTRACSEKRPRNVRHNTPKAKRSRRQETHRRTASEMRPSGRRPRRKAHGASGRQESFDTGEGTQGEPVLRR